MTTLLVTTGAESSGKTTLATALATALRAPLAPEVARSWLGEQRLKSPAFQYQQSDLLTIARLQCEAEQQAMKAADQWLVCDTDLLVIMIWSQLRFGNCDPVLEALFRQSLQYPRRYLLCTPDMPWQADPLRENPDDRHILHQLYSARLQQLALPFQTMEGTADTRLACVLEQLRIASRC